ncbi:MAG: hypothetical protein J6T46_05060 [Victivallales bacterium]|nr:hypothetical protein [Victivallales bacterium]MBO7620203.1 hypothetical protein [Victivallales bacterium]
MTPRLRMFAGPNGSGKTTLAMWLSRDYAVNLYHFINADIMFAEIKKSCMTACPFSVDHADLLEYVRNSTWPEEEKGHFLSGDIKIDHDMAMFAPSSINSYTVAILADFFKFEYVCRGDSFSFETVFSHPSKVELLKSAQAAGFRTYMYFVATDKPEINLERIRSRVQNGGHDVPADKIIERYSRSLENAAKAIPYLNRVFFFDNSGDSIQFICEADDNGLQLYANSLPDWFVKYFIP